MSQHSRNIRFSLGGLLPPAVKYLLIANTAIYLLNSVMVSEGLWKRFGLTPALFWDGWLWQPVTYMFFHAGFSHLLFNMLALWMFGSVLESVWGTKGFLRYFFLVGIGSGLSNCLLTPASMHPIIGASGAIYGLLAAYGLLFPNSIIYLSFLFPIKAKYLVIIFGLFEFFASVNAIGGQSHVANIVHLGGMFIGIIYLKHHAILRYLARKMRDSTQQHQEKKVVREEEDAEDLQQEVDDLLDKINEVGLGNLTPWEKKRLREASQKLKKM